MGHYMTSSDIAMQFSQRVDANGYMRLTVKQVEWLMGQFKRENPQFISSPIRPGCNGIIGDISWTLNIQRNGSGIFIVKEI